MNASLLDRYRDESGGVDACWPYTGTPHRGYGRVTVNGFRQLAHRYAYEMEFGQIPDDMTIDHLCRNTRCCNPSHLEVVTLSENVRRAMRARWDEATHCGNGHPIFDGSHWVYDRGNGHRKRTCRSCEAERTGTPNQPRVLATHCKGGHPFDEKNTRFVERDGRRVRRCRACVAASQRRTAARRRAAEVAT